MNKMLLAALPLLLFACSSQVEPTDLYLSSDQPKVELYSIDKNGDVKATARTAVRGTKVSVYPSSKSGYSLFIMDGLEYVVPQANLSADFQDVVQEKKLYVRTPASIVSDTVHSKVSGLASKGDSLSIVGYDRIDSLGVVHRYLVQNPRDTSAHGYVFSKYLVSSLKDAKLRYGGAKFDSLLAKVRSPHGGGDVMRCDFYPVQKPVFPGRKMPDVCRGFYLNISPLVIGNIDKYISLAKTTRINTFVIDIKDDTCPGYKAEAMKTYSPTTYAHGGSNKADMYAYAVRRLHEEGFWVAGRITCFKDSYYVKDHPEAAITDKDTGAPLYHNRANWPSAYDRGVWQYNVELAKESVRRFGFDEINFDYVRFPDKMISIENRIDYHNRYGETKVDALQRFVSYACDELHECGVYVSIDVFGECASPRYVTAYGQFWPALSNVADVMCGMPYPDHFPDHYCGISKPWNNPYATLKAWGTHVKNRQGETPSPARVRTWIQAYHVLKYVDPAGIDYNASNIKLEIKALDDAGVNDGYVTWLSSSNLGRYTDIADAFK